uniref:EF-hand domain-containing protein n=1 Tax=Electrophorus electricus TaxID=8005 RepID=A0A4W4GY95_ELEEL
MLPVNAFNNLDYWEFLKKFTGEPQEAETARGTSSPDSAGQSESSANVVPWRPKTQPRRPSTVCERSEVALLRDCDAVERRLRSQIQSCWSEVQRRCKEADIERSGELDTDTFLGMLFMLYAASSLPQMSAGHLSRQCMDALLMLCAPVQLYWRSMRRAFISHDKETNKTTKLHVCHSQQVLKQHNIHLSEEDLFHLTSFFDKNISGNISYNDFLLIFQK